MHYKIFHDDDDDDDDDDVYRHVGLRRSSVCMLARLGKTCQSIEFQFLTIGGGTELPTDNQIPLHLGRNWIRSNIRGKNEKLN